MDRGAEVVIPAARGWSPPGWERMAGWACNCSHDVDSHARWIGNRTFVHRLIRRLERLVYRLCGIEEEREHVWTEYAASLLMFSIVALLLTYLIERFQGWLPFNPQGLGAKVMTPDLAFNTAVS